MGVVSKYFSDDDLINGLRKQFSRDKQYSVDFRFWLNTAKKTRDGLIVTVEDRSFLVDEFTGSVIREVR